MSDGKLECLHGKLDAIFGVISYKERKEGVQWYTGYDYLDDHMWSVADYPHQFVVGSQYGVEMRLMIRPDLTPLESEWVNWGRNLEAARDSKERAARKARKAAKKAAKAKSKGEA